MTDQQIQERMIRHGELMLWPVETAPDNPEFTPATDRQYIAAHSAMGHHHVIYGDVAVGQSNDRTYVQLFKGGTLKHLKGHDAHQDMPVLPGTYEIIHKQS